MRQLLFLIALFYTASATADTPDPCANSSTAASRLQLSTLLVPIESVKKRLMNVYDKGDTYLYLPVYAYHDRNAYEPAKIAEYNELALGFGIGKQIFNESGNQERLFVMAHLDSHADMQINAGYSWQKMFSVGGNTKLGLGFNAGLFSRADMASRLPLPYVFPMASLNHKDDYSLEFVLIPKFGGGINQGSVVFVYFTKRLTDGDRERGRAVASSLKSAVSSKKLPAKLDGDVGLAVYHTQSIVKGGKDSVSPLPYAYVDYGRLFARIDTVGIKTAELGEYGHLEFVARVNRDGFKTDTAELQGLTERKNALPVGIGTFQKTPIGGFNVNAFVDAGPSNGAILEATYAAKFDLGKNVAVYPMVGAEYLSKNFVRYYYGVTDQEAGSSGHSVYRPEHGALQPSIGAMITAKPFKNKNWTLNAYLKCKKLAASVTDSPIVDKENQCTSFLGASYVFK